MFVIYSPEGQKSLDPSKIQLDMVKIAHAKPSSAVGDSILDKAHLNNTAGLITATQAIKQYQNTSEKEHGQPVVIVGDIMTHGVLVIHLDKPVHEAWALMQSKNINHLAVLDDQESLVGIISSHDILQKAIVGDDGTLDLITHQRIKDLMDKRVITTHAQTDIRKIAVVMSEYKVGFIVITSGTEKLIGVVTLSDLVRRLAQPPPITLYA